MRRQDALARLKHHEAAFRRLGVESLYLFGSTARDDAASLSDVDLFFDYTRGTFGVFELMDVKNYASQVLGGSVDILTRDSLHAVLRPEIEASAVRIF